MGADSWRDYRGVRPEPIGRGQSCGRRQAAAAPDHDTRDAGFAQRRRWSRATSCPCERGSPGRKLTGKRQCFSPRRERPAFLAASARFSGSARLDEYLERSISRRIENGHRRDPGFADLPHFPAERIAPQTTPNGNVSPIPHRQAEAFSCLAFLISAIPLRSLMFSFAIPRLQKAGVYVGFSRSASL